MRLWTRFTWINTRMNICQKFRNCNPKIICKFGFSVSPKKKFSLKKEDISSEHQTFAGTYDGFLYLSLLITFFQVSFFSSHSFSLQIWWQRPGCDPITGLRQQSPSADWFYNPLRGSQMEGSQLAKKCCSDGCHTGTPASHHPNIHTQACTRMHMTPHKTLAFFQQYHTSESVVFLLFYPQKFSKCVFTNAYVWLCGWWHWLHIEYSRVYR